MEKLMNLLAQGSPTNVVGPPQEQILQINKKISRIFVRDMNTMYTQCAWLINKNSSRHGLKVQYEHSDPVRSYKQDYQMPSGGQFNFIPSFDKTQLDKIYNFDGIRGDKQKVINKLSGLLFNLKNNASWEVPYGSSRHYEEYRDCLKYKKRCNIWNYIGSSNFVVWRPFVKPSLLGTQSGRFIVDGGGGIRNIHDANRALYKIKDTFVLSCVDMLQWLEEFLEENNITVK